MNDPQIHTHVWSVAGEQREMLPHTEDFCARGIAPQWLGTFSPPPTRTFLSDLDMLAAAATSLVLAFNVPSMPASLTPAASIMRGGDVTMKASSYYDKWMDRAEAAAKAADYSNLGGSYKPATSTASGAQAATSGAMSVSQACTFFAANPTIDEAEKSAFLKSKGVSDFVIAQAICTSTGMEKTVAGHP